MARTCLRCQGQASDDAAFCPNCGAPLIAASADPVRAGTTNTPPGGPPASPTPKTATYVFDAARWSTEDRITGGATLVLLISLFLPWFSVGGFFAVSGLTAHGYLYLVLFIAIALLVYLGARAGWDRIPISFSLAHGPVMLTASLASFVLVLIGFLLKPGDSAVSWSVGAWLAVVASIVAAAPIAVPVIQARRGR